ncbi:MAG: helix-hairpin-helix domain-containing protein [Firmicutes bacterium]|nr:helix-hairpin-helix domain-containing protein [Bacillota bacterium]
MKGLSDYLKSLKSIKNMNFSEVLIYAKENKKIVEKVILAVLLIVCLILFTFGKDEPADIVIASSSETEYEVDDSEVNSERIAAGQIYVDVQGAVQKPGVVVLSEGARVFQAIEAAGGLASLSDTAPLNLAQQLYDGDKLYVPFVGETELAQESGSAGLAGSVGYASSGNGKININTATSEELQSLSGIGIVTAGKIIDYRAKNGKFTKPEDIKNVSGIGERTYENIKNDICV